MPTSVQAPPQAPSPAAPPRGRSVFRRWAWALRAVQRLLRLLPGGMLDLLWTWSDLLPGMAGLGLRYCVAAVRAAECGENVYVGPGVEIRGWAGLRLGSNVSIHRGCYVDAAGGITLGDDVSVAHQTSILSFEHTWDDASIPIRDNPTRLSAVEIGNDVWIGCGCRILAGTRVGDRCVVAAGAVTRGRIPAGALVGGVPARVLKEIG
jgi:acetyltransferase-like isoleucine patch superfamily enzyme